MRIVGNIVVDETRLFKVLTLCSLFYLYFPVVLFNAGWLRWPYCIVLPVLDIFVVGYVLWDNFKTRVEGPTLGDFSFPKIHLLILFVGITIWSLLSGNGGLGFSQGDLFSYDGGVKDLCFMRWPIIIESPPGSPLHDIFHGTPWYYVNLVGFYLPAGLVGKITQSFAVACWFQVFWSYAGSLLALGWFIALCKNRRDIAALYATVIIFMFFRPNNFLVRTVFGNFYNLFHFGNGTVLRYFSPHHSLAGWCVAGMVLGCARKKVSFLCVSAALSACFITTSFALVGAILFWLVLLFRNFHVLWRQWKKQIALHLLLSVAVVMPGLFYVASNQFSYSGNWIINNPDFTFFRYASALFVSIGIPLIILFWGGCKSFSEDKGWFYAIVVSLWLTTLFNMGICNDFAFQASKCSLFMLNILIADKLYDSGWKSVPAFAVASLCLIAIATFLNFCVKNRANLGIPPTEEAYSKTDFINKIEPVQTSGNPHFFFWRHLADAKGIKNTCNE